MQSSDDFFHAGRRGSRTVGRRRVVLGATLGLVVAGPASAARVRSLDDPLLVGVELDLQRSGLAGALQRAFARDVGIALKLEPAPAARVLERLEAGEVDAGITNAGPAEQRLAEQSLVHDRHRVAAGRFLIVGPATASPAAGAGRAAEETDAVAWLQRLARDAGAPDGPRFLSPQDGSGAHLAEQGLWRAAGVAPQAPWYLKSDPTRPLLAQARALGAHALVDAALFGAAASGLVVKVEHDPRLRFDVHLMRSFRVHHPAGPLFTRWVSGGRGRRVVDAVRGYTPVRS